MMKSWLSLSGFVPNQMLPCGRGGSFVIAVKPERHLVIDGHNIIHAWPDSRRLMRESMESAHAHVVAAGLVVHDTEHMRVTVVFDGKGSEITSEPASEGSDCLVVFAPASMTADDLIEQLVGASESPAAIVVATGDRLERETVSSLGAEVISPKNLESWVDRCRSVQSRRVLNRSAQNNWHNPLPL